MPVAPPVHRTRPKPKAWENRKQGTTTERGYGWEWQKLRRQVVQRDSGLCQQCMRENRVRSGRHVDHVTPKAKGGSDEMGNLELLCVPCHNAKTAREDSK